jgi:hypothetical protein
MESEGVLYVIVILILLITNFGFNMYTSVDKAYNVEVFKSLKDLYNIIKVEGFTIFDYGEFTIENLRKAFKYERVIYLVKDEYKLGVDWTYKLQKH